MAFGFDPSIILAQKQYTGPDPHETVRTMAQLAGMAQQRQMNEATLAGLLEKQNQERALANIYRATGSNVDALPQALMSGGFGKEALGVREHIAETGARDASRENVLSQILQRGKEQLTNLLYGTKDQADYEARLATVPPEQRGMFPRTWDEAKPLVESLALPPERRAQLEHQGEQLEETKRHNRAMEGRPSGIPGLAIITGEGGVQYLADTRNPAAPAKPIVDETGKPIAKPAGRQQRALTKGDRDALASSHDEQANLDTLLQRFKPDYAGKGAVGAATVGLNKKLGSWASDSAQEEANFWADFQGTFDIARRNKMFGASLTPGESAAWEAAKTITPNSKPEVVKKALARLRDAARDSAKRRGLSLAKDGYAADAIEVYTGPLGMDSDEPKTKKSEAAPTRKVIGGKTYTRTQDGQWEVDE